MEQKGAILLFNCVTTVALTIACPAAVLEVPSVYATLGSALGAASAGDTILIASGRYLEHDLVMAVPVTIIGEPPYGGGGGVVLDADHLGRVLSVVDLPDVASIRHVSFVNSGNWPQYGGTVLCSNSALTLQECLFEGNWNPAGGGLSCREDATVTVDQCRFLGNGAIAGGAIHANTGASLRISGCLFYNNGGAWYGGAVYCSRTPLQMTNCTLSGGGSEDGVVYLMNTAAESAELANCTITFATLSTAFGSSGGPIDLTCCNIYGNHSGDWVGAIAGQFGLDGNISVDPLYCDAANGDLFLDASSPLLPQNNSCGTLIGALGQGCSSTPVPDAAGPIGLRIASIAPNAGSAPVTILLSAPGHVDARLRIHDVRGRMVREIEATAPGRVRWDGRDAQGRTVPSGRYLCVVEGAGVRVTRALLLVR